MPSGFFKGYNIKGSNFFDHVVPMKPKTYCVVIVYMDGGRVEHQGITNPWKYMIAVKKNPKVLQTFIKTYEQNTDSNAKVR